MFEQVTGRCCYLGATVQTMTTAKQAMLTSFASEAWSQRYLIKFIVCDYVLLMLCHLLLPSTVREFKMNSHVPACGLEATQLTYVLYAFCTIHVNVANALCYSTSKGIHCTRTVV